MIKKVFLLIYCILISFSVTAIQIIKFTWEGSLTKKINITATGNEQFFINWGDGSDIETKTGTGEKQVVEYVYATSGRYTVTITGENENCLFPKFDCKGNNILNLDLNMCTSLMELDCSSNLLTGLELNNCTELTTLNCIGIRLQGLDVSACTKLEELNCAANYSFYSLNVTGCTELRILNLSTCNHVSNLDLSTCPELTYLNCSGNKLQNLDLRANTKLKYLDCYFNHNITSLNLSNCTELTYLDCAYNALSSLDLSACTKLEYLECYRNKLQLSELYKLSKAVIEGCITVLDYQRLDSEKIFQQESVDFSSQIVFDNIPTVFEVRKDYAIAVIDIDYTINDGIIIFYKTGFYEVIMTNSAIIALAPYGDYYSPRVEARFVVESNNEISNEKPFQNIRIYPNPTTGQLTIDNGQLINGNVEIFDVSGRIVYSSTCSLVHSSANSPVHSSTKIDISFLEAGGYFLHVNENVFKIIKN